MLLSVALAAQGHPGRTDAEGCHAGKLPRHCHGLPSSDRAAWTGRDRPAKEPGNAAARSRISEDGYNRLFCAAAGGVTETRHTCTYDGGSSHVKLDCETDTTVYEGGRQTSAEAQTARSRRCFSAT